MFARFCAHCLTSVRITKLLDRLLQFFSLFLRATILSLILFTIGTDFTVANEQTAHSECTTYFSTYDPPVYGWIGGVYCAYASLDEPTNPHMNKLGKPLKKETDDLKSGQRYQQFEHGRIYLHKQEQAAFALFDDILDTYLGREDEFGFPITSQIGGPGNCRAYFDNGYIPCNGDPVPWDANHSRFDSLPHDVPKMTLPFAGKVFFTGSLHGWDYGGDFGTPQPKHLGMAIY